MIFEAKPRKDFETLQNQRQVATASPSKKRAQPHHISGLTKSTII